MDALLDKHNQAQHYCELAIDNAEAHNFDESRRFLMQAIALDDEIINEFPEHPYTIGVVLEHRTIAIKAYEGLPA